MNAHIKKMEAMVKNIVNSQQRGSWGLITVPLLPQEPSIHTCHVQSSRSIDTSAINDLGYEKLMLLKAH